jgi:hypothetical protein
VHPSPQIFQTLALQSRSTLYPLSQTQPQSLPPTLVHCPLLSLRFTPLSTPLLPRSSLPTQRYRLTGTSFVFTLATRAAQALALESQTRRIVNTKVPSVYSPPKVSNVAPLLLTNSLMSVLVLRKNVGLTHHTLFSLSIMEMCPGTCALATFKCSFREHYERTYCAIAHFSIV